MYPACIPSIGMASIWLDGMQARRSALLPSSTSYSPILTAAAKNIYTDIPIICFNL